MENQEMSLTGILNHFAKFAEKLGCTKEVCVTVKQWNGSEPYLNVMLCSKRKNPANHQALYLLSAEIKFDNKLNFKILELRLEAEYLTKKGELNFE